MASYKVLNGETSNGLTLNDKDTMCVYNGGAANKTTVNSGGTMTVLAGATATEILENGGYVTIGESGPNVTFKKNTFKNLVLENNITTVHSGTTATNITVNYDARLYVSSGGIANNISVNDHGCLDIWAGGSASGVTITKDGLLALYEYNGGGGAATDVTVGTGGHVIVMSGTTAANVMLSGGDVFVYDGGTATIAFSPLMKGLITSVPGAVVTILDPEANVYYVNETSVISSADTMKNLNIVSGESAYVYDGGTLNNTTINANGIIEVNSGGVANITTVNNLAALFISSGGIADKATVNGICAVCSSGVAISATVNSGGIMYVSSTGEARNTTVNSGGSMELDGTADNTTVNTNGRLYVEDGGTADKTTVNANGYMWVSAGGTATNTTVYEYGSLNVEDGGTAVNTTVNGTDSGGDVWVNSGGMLNNTTVNANGVIYLHGTATKTTVNSGGYLCLQRGGTATEIEAVDGAYLLFVVGPDTYAQGTSAGSAFEIKNGVAANFTLTCGELVLSSGGTASKTTLSSHGYIRVYSGGKAVNTTVNSGGIILISGGLAESATVNEGGSMRVAAGGTANSMTVKSGGELQFGSKGGTLTGRMTFSAGAVVSAKDDAVIDFDLTHTSPTSAALVNDLSIVQGTPMYTLTVNGAQSIGAYKLADGASGFGSKTEITVRNPVGTDLGVLTVDSKSNTFSYGGKKYTLQLNDASLVIIVSPESGSENVVMGDVNGHTVITEGSSALGVNVNGGGMLEIQPGGKGNIIMVNNGGLLLTTDAQVKGVTIDKGGTAYLGSDTVMKSLVINGGEAHVESDGWAFQTSNGNNVSSNTIVKNGGMLYISGGGHVEGLLASDGGHVIVESDGALNGAKFAGATLDALNGADVSSVTLLNGGTMKVFAGGSAQGVTISEGGILAVESGGELNHINVSAGGVLTGVVKSGVMIRMYGGTIDFDISGFTPDSAPAYLYEDTDINSDEAYPCTLTVGDAQAYGTYGLLSYAYGFDCTITVQDTSGKELGTLTAGSTASINGVDYTLNIGGSPAYPLTVTIADNEAPAITNIAADITGTTNQNVTVTAKFSDNVKLASAQYKVGDGAWTDYTTGVVVTGNAIVHFKATDAAGNSTEAQYEVTNIDKEKPTVTNVVADITAPTNQNVTVTADFGDNGGIAFGQYRIGDGAWTDYAGGVSMEENGTLSFKAVDMAGNESEIVSITIGNIDKVAPTVSNVKADVTAPTNQNVTVTADFGDNGGIAFGQYRIGDGVWTDYIAGVSMAENGSLSFKATDMAGNESEIVSIAIGNIDKEKPVKPNASADVTETTTGSVNVTATFSGDSVKREYSLDGGSTWSAYTAPVEFTANGSVLFRGTDAAGNESDVETYSVTNIEVVTPDTVDPIVTNITASPTKPTNQDVIVTADFTDNVEVAQKLYRIGAGTWTNYVDGVSMTENGTVYFKVVDTSGNESSGNDSITVSNIDKVKPTITNITPSTTEPATSVTVTANFSDDVALASKQYRIGTSGAWMNYVDGVTVTANGTVYFKAVDKAGNDATAQYEVTNIEDPTPENGPEEPYNNTLLTDTKDVNEKIKNAYGTILTAAGQEIRLDKIGTLDYGEKHYHNHVGKSTSLLDDNYKFDYAKIVLEHGAKLSFHAEATAAATFTVYSLTEKKGKYTLKKLQTLKLTDKDEDGVFTADSSKLLSLSVSGAYYVSMQYTDKKADEAYYNVTLNDTSEFYPYSLGDNSDDWGDMKTKGYGGAVGNLGVIDAASLAADKAVIKDEWIGFGDKVDCKRFTLESAAELSFTVNAPDGPLKLSVCKLKSKTKGETTTWSQVTVKTITVKAGQAKDLNLLRLEAGDYFFKVESSNVKKSTGYDVQVTHSDFYVDGDGGWNNVLLDKKTLSENEAHFYNNRLAGSGAIHFDKADNDRESNDYAEFTYNDKPYGGFVGYGDEIDFAKLTLTETSDVTFTLTATNDATLEIYKVTEKDGKYTKKSLQTVKYKAGSDPASSKKPVTLEVKDGVSYYVSVKATNIKKTTVDPRTYYDVTYAVASEEESALSMPETASVASALSMPETDSLADSLAMPDSLSLDQYDTDVLAGIYLDSASDKLLGESGNGFLASL